MVSKDNKELNFLNLPARTIEKFRTIGSWCLFGSWLLIILLSCKSVPQIPDIIIDDKNVLLESGASVYLFANVQEARRLIEILPIAELKNSQSQQMIDKTSFAAVALFSHESALSFQLVALGNYPSSGARMLMGMDKNWTKHRAPEGYTYWYSSASQLSIALNQRQAFITSSKEQVPPLASSPGAAVPEGFNSFRRQYASAALSGWVEDPGPSIQYILSQARVPIRFPVKQLFINLNEVGQSRYEAVLRLQFENATQARGMAAILNLAGVFSINDPELMLAALFLANPPVQSGNNLDIKSAALSEEELLLLYSILSYF